MNLPYSPACEQNQRVIYAAIDEHLGQHVLEIGAGTGQHAVYFARKRQDLIWQTSDLAIHLPAIVERIKQSGLSNLPPPVLLDVLGAWPVWHYDTVFSANCLHIMDEPMVEACLQRVGEALPSGGRLLVYGPFNYGGNYTAPSNQRFDQMLRSRNPDSGIKDFEWLNGLALQVNLQLLDDIEMPENNRTIIWQKRTL